MYREQVVGAESIRCRGILGKTILKKGAHITNVVKALGINYCRRYTRVNKNGVVYKFFMANNATFDSMLVLMAAFPNAVVKTRPTTWMSDYSGVSLFVSIPTPIVLEMCFEDEVIDC